MGGFRNLFLGVYASNAAIRTLFLPLCYAIFISPFAALLVRRYQLHQRVLDYLPKEYQTVDRLPQLFISLVAVVLATRLVSGKRHGAEIVEGGKRRVQLLPYWFPGARHLTNMVFGGDRWLKKSRDSSTSSIVGYNLAGARRNIILSPQILAQLSQKAGSLAEEESTSWIIPHNVFGMPSSAKDQYTKLWPRISSALDSEVLRGGKMEGLVTASLDILSQSLPDLITFNSSLVDQMQWERVAGIELTDGTVEAEAELFALVSEFFCSAIVGPITGAQFPETYILLASHLAELNQSFYKLALGVPRFFPLPGLPGASFAKKQLLQNLTNLFEDLSNPPAKEPIRGDESESGEETDADTPTPLTALNELFSRYDLPLTARASITLELLHTVASETVPLAFWILLHIYSLSTPNPGKAKEQMYEVPPLVKIRGETKDWAQATQPPSLHPSFPAPPEIRFNKPGQLFSEASFPYIRSAIKEARRLYSFSSATVQITKPIILTEIESTRPGTKVEWELDAETYIDIGTSQRLINTSAANYIAADQYIPDRFLSSQSLPPVSVSPAEPAEELTTALLIAFVAGVTQLWDIAAAPKKTIQDHWREASAAAAGEKPSQQVGRVGIWKVPKTTDGAGVLLPKGEVRVRIRRREGLDGPNRMQEGQ